MILYTAESGSVPTGGSEGCGPVSADPVRKTVSGPTFTLAYLRGGCFTTRRGWKATSQTRLLLILAYKVEDVDLRLQTTTC